MRLSWQPAYDTADLVEVGVEEQRAHRVLSARRAAVDADARDVVPRVLRGEGLVPEDAIGKAGVLDVLPGHVVKRLRAIGRAHAVHLHDDESELGLGLHAAPGHE